MIRAVFKDGVLHPLDPPPSEWLDGRELLVEEASDVDAELSKEELRRWYQDLEEMVDKLDADDIERMEAAIREADEQAKALVRREMGLD